MADFVAENAFLEALTGENNTANEYRVDRSAEESAAASPEPDERDDMGDSLPAPAAPANDDDDDYDPSGLVTEQASAKPTSKSTSLADPQNGGIAKQSLRKGGFLIESDDEADGDGNSTPTANGGIDGAGGSSDAQRSATGTPVAAFISAEAHVSVPSTQNLSSRAIASTNLPISNPSNNRAVSNPAVASAGRAEVDAARASDSTVANSRDPNDIVGILEDRIQEDPRGDVEAWLELLHEHQTQDRFDHVRNVYTRFFQYFPTAVPQLLSYLDMELSLNELGRLQNKLQEALHLIPNLQLWNVYLNFVLRTQDLESDTPTNAPARKTIMEVYQAVLDQIGIDKDSGSIWQNYIQFIQSSPHNAGGPTLEDQKKLDTLRKTYQQAISLPTQAVQGIWQEYYAFENSLNKATAKKFLQDNSPSFITAKQEYIQLHSITANLDRTKMARLPPAPGFEGYEEHREQVAIWKRWIQWERGDPLVLKADNFTAYFKRVVYAYKQATICMRFEPEFWYEATEFCFSVGMENDGNTFLTQGIAANPESCLLAFMQADRIESTLPAGSGDEYKDKCAAMVRPPFEKALDALYELLAQTEKRKKKSIERIEEKFAQTREEFSADEMEEDEIHHARKAREQDRNAQIKAVEMVIETHISQIKKTLTFAWIALIRAMRRIQGKGRMVDKGRSDNDPKGRKWIGGLREAFEEARKRGRLTSDVYVAAALMEHYCYREAVIAENIFSRGSRLFKNDPKFQLEHIKHLININDITNARAKFEEAVGRFTSHPETVHDCKALFHLFYRYEANYGDLSQISKLEKRMSKLFPEDPHLTTFAMRYQIMGSEEFDPTRAQLLISMPAQAKPKAIPSIEREGGAGAPSSRDSPAPPAGVFSPRAAASPRLGLLAGPPATGRYSPKRPFAGGPADAGESPPRKLARGESPLKGAAGRRLDAAKRRAAAAAASGSAAPPPPQQMAQGGAQPQQMMMPLPPLQPAPAPELHRDINVLLGMIPRRDAAAAWPGPGAGALVRMLQMVPPGQLMPGGAAAAGMQRERSGQGVVARGSMGAQYGQGAQGYQQHYGYGPQ